MGVRTYYNGIRRAEIIPLFRRKDSANPYTSYRELSRKLSDEKYPLDQVRANLKKKVDEGFVSLEELLAGGRATGLFTRAGIYNESVDMLAKRRAVILSRPGSQLERFLLKESIAVPYVVEHLLPEDVAQALGRCSEPLRQRSVTALNEIERGVQHGEEEALTVAFDVIYDEARGDITTRFFPGSVQQVLCFDRQAKRVVTINRGAVITDRWVANLSAILDALGRLTTSPLDQILICLSDNQGRVYPDLPTVVRWPEGSSEEIISRDHFTEGARQAIHEVVKGEYERMVAEKGMPLSFRPYITRTISGKLELRISWQRGS